MDQQKTFRLKRYYIVYGGLGAVIFYGLLFFFIVNAERQALYDQYVFYVQEKAKALYHDLERDFLQPRGLVLAEIGDRQTLLRLDLHKEIGEIVESDFALAKVKVISATGIVLYDHEKVENEGKPYSSEGTAAFRAARQGEVSSKVEVDNGNSRFMEVYLPIKDEQGQVSAIVEIYEDVSRYEEVVGRATQKALLLPSIIFVVFNLLLYLIVAKADRIITANTELLTAIRKNMEKYISSSAVEAIYRAVTSRKELFRGERQNLVIFFSDIRGFTSYSEKSEPEAVVEELNRVFQIQADIIHSHGGVIDKFIGDEIMAAFPDHSAEQAVTSGLKIVQALASQVGGERMVGIGIHRGEAVVGSLGTEERRDYTAIGDTINIGSRLCSNSGAGQVAISTEIFKALGPDIQERFMERKMLEMKGKAEKMEVYIAS